MSASKDKGTRAETAVVDFLRAVGFKHAERRTTRGAKDAGDVSGIPGLVIEVKNCQRMELATWVDEALTELANQLGERRTELDDGGIAAVWHKRRGKRHAGDWYVTMTGLDFASLLLDAYEPEA